MRKSRVILNEDMTNFVYCMKLRGSDGSEITEQLLRDYMDNYADTGITDLFLNVGGLSSATDSEVKTSYSKRAHVTFERGQAVDYQNTYAGLTDTVLHKNGLDIYTIWIDECKKNEIHPWLSFRMNDCHRLFEAPNALVPPEIYENFPTRSRIRHREQLDYYDRCRDFELAEVRAYERDYILEMLDRYDVYGIELDFQRELECFGIGREESGRKVMVEYVAELKSAVSKFEEKYGHKIRIALRGHQSPELSYEMGFDIGEMARRGLLDMYIASPRWSSSDMDMPLVLWKQLLEPYGVEVMGAVELQVASYVRHWPWTYIFKTTTYEVCCALAASVLSQGCGVYLFNYFYVFGANDPIKREWEGKKPVYGAEKIFAEENLYNFWNIAGDLDALMTQNRKCIVMPVDKAAVWRLHTEQLPLNISKRVMPGFLKITTGKITQGRVLLHLGIVEAVEPEADLEVYVNSTLVRFVRSMKCTHPVLTEAAVYEFEIDRAALSETVQVAEILLKKDKSVTFDYADIEILAAE